MNSQQNSHSVNGRFSRRVVLNGVAGTGLAAALLAAMGPDLARSQASPTPEVPPGYSPNGFSLDGPDTHISYGTTSMDGRPIFSYRGRYPEHTYRGEEIHLEGSVALGPMVSVSLDALPNVRAAWLTLLLPEFRPIQLGDPPIPFITLAVITTYPVEFEGAGQTYEVMELEGTAVFAMS